MAAAFSVARVSSSISTLLSSSSVLMVSRQKRSSSSSSSRCHTTTVRSVGHRYSSRLVPTTATKLFQPRQLLPQQRIVVVTTPAPTTDALVRMITTRTMMRKQNHWKSLGGTVVITPSTALLRINAPHNHSMNHSGGGGGGGVAVVVLRLVGSRSSNSISSSIQRHLPSQQQQQQLEQVRSFASSSSTTTSQIPLSSSQSSTTSSSSASNPTTSTTTSTLSFLMKWYEEQLSKRPIVTKMITGSFLWGIGDMVAQVIPQLMMVVRKNENKDNNSVTNTTKDDDNDEHDNHVHELFVYDSIRTGRAVLFGFAIHAPLSHLHYNILEYMTIQMKFTSWYAIPLFKAFMEQFVYWSWISNSIYFAAMGAMQGMNLSQIYQRISDVLWETQVAQWTFWIPIQLVNFRYTPVRHQLNVVLVTSIVWTALLSMWYPPMKQNTTKKNTLSTATSITGDTDTKEEMTPTTTAVVIVDVEK